MTGRQADCVRLPVGGLLLARRNGDARFTILTTTTDVETSELHDRTSVILEQQDWPLCRCGSARGGFARAACPPEAAAIRMDL
jgi:hypothetical protein